MLTTLTNKKILLLDDEVNIRRSIQSGLENEDYQVAAFSDSVKAFESLATDRYDLAILDIRLKEIDGIHLFKKMKANGIDVPVIFISGNASMEEAVCTVKDGAYDFLEKPFSIEKLIVTMKNCFDYYSLKDRLIQLEETRMDNEMIGDDKVILKLKKEINKVAGAETTVLISGESGTGKELIAQMLHDNSRRNGKKFIKVNCSAIPENLIESELFGHEKGAFTGADFSKKGYFEVANGGTLFLDEIGDMSLSAQTKVLRALQNSEIQKIGSENPVKINVRIIAATHKDLKQEVKSNKFREDLFYRINVIPIKSPALRNHPNDIPLLINDFINKIAKINGIKPKKINSDCFGILKKYSWPGNVRELYNLIERLVIMSGERIMVSDIPSEFMPPAKTEFINYQGMPLKEFRDIVEKDYITSILKTTTGNISKAARILKIDRTYLHRKMSQFDISKKDYF